MNLNPFKKQEPKIMTVQYEEEKLVEPQKPVEVVKPIEPAKIEEPQKEEEVISIEQVIVATYQKTLELERIINLLLENVLLVNTNLLNQATQPENKPGRPKKE